MLADKKVKAFVPATDAGSARRFYGETLGLTLTDEDDYGLTFEMQDALLRLPLVAAGQMQPQSHTVLGWTVPRISETLLWLKSRGVECERYPFLQQDASGIWTAPNGAQVAWFKDPFGNVLSVDQQP